MICRYCGMDSGNPQVCEWCNRILAGPNAGQVAQHGAPAAQQSVRRVALTGEEVVTPVQPAPPEPTISLPPVAARGTGTHPAPTAPQPPRPTINTYGLSAAAISTTMVQQQVDRHRVSEGEKWDRFMALAMPLTLASLLIIHYWPGLLTFVSLCDMFLISIFLGATGVIGSYDDEYMDVGTALIVTFLLGPLVALVAYVIVGLIRQDMHKSIIMVLVGHMTVRTVVWIAFMTSGGSQFSLMPALMVFSVAGILGPTLSFAGWIMSSFFRPLTE